MADPYDRDDRAPPADRLGEAAAALRAALTPLLHRHAGQPPRPVRLTRGLGLDKTLASRLVQALRAESDLDLLHQIPSPTGLRIVLERAHPDPGDPGRRPLEAAVRRFEELLDSLPGGRQALDARMGEASGTIREHREQIARQASFKSQSFLFGHFCETLTTALVLCPSATPGRVDAIEVHRRIGLQRLVPSMPVPLLSVGMAVSDGSAPQMLPLDRDTPGTAIEDFLVGTTGPSVNFELVREGPLTTFVVPAGIEPAPPQRLTTAWRIVRVLPSEPEAPWLRVRNYMLHTPCRTLVRDLFVDEALWPDAAPRVDFHLPGPTGLPLAQVEPGQPHLRRLNLTARVEPLPPGPAGLSLGGSPDQAGVLTDALARAGVDPARLRGWRCRMTYPLPLVEMLLSLRFGSR